MANPFDLKGPEFLVVYLAFGVLVNALFRLVRGGLERGGLVPSLDDPYEIAYLRGGQQEAMRVAAVSLMDRGLLRQSDGDKIVAVDDVAAERVRRPIERALLREYATPTPVSRMLSAGPGSPLTEACREIRGELGRRHLLADAAAIRRRALPYALGVIALVGVSGAKIAVALSRGRHNIEFLILLTVVFGVILFTQFLRSRTELGDAAVERAKRRFKALRERAEALNRGGATSEVALLAAVFGLGALPAILFPYVGQLFPKAHAAASVTGGCGGSGCGGGGSDGGGGGGCGGGGCGGCGGCGG